MIKNSKQTWEIGQMVSVGFLKGLTVLAKITTPGDYAPDAYILTKGTAFYSFIPHNGLSRVTADMVETMIEDSKAKAQRDAEHQAEQAAAWDLQFAHCVLFDRGGIIMTPTEFRAARKTLGLSQTEMGIALGTKSRSYSVRAVQTWEAGTRTIPPAVEALLTILLEGV